MITILKKVRDTWHPLHHLRKFSTVRTIMRLLDVPIWITIYGIKYKVRVRLMRNASYLVNRRTIEPEIVALFLAIYKVFAPKTFWDIGANIGVYSYLLKSLDDKIEVKMFEPDPVNLALIEQTTRRARLGSIDVYPCAVSDEAGIGTFALDSISGATGTLENPALSFTFQHYRVAPAFVSVHKVTVDSVRERAKTVDLMKIDVEGHEERVFRGAVKTLSQDQPIMIFECFDPAATLVTQLHELGYLLFDAAKMTVDLGNATNFLALPSRHVSRVQELATTWQHEYDVLIK
jgi:FkbM family methyltransferase